MPEIFEYSFMQKAFAAGVIIAILASTLGMFVVVRRYSMLSDSLAHISLLGVAFGFLFSVSPTVSAVVVALSLSFLIEYLRAYHNLYSDSILAIFLSGSLALAVIIVSVSNSFNTSLFDYLFGSIVAISDEELIGIAIFGTACLLLIMNFYRKLLFAAFSEEAAAASGVNVKFLNFLLIALVAVTIGLSIKMVGALLIGALMVMPVVAALQFKTSFLATLALSVIFSTFSVLAGLTLSFYLSLPSGATIVVVALLVFIVALGAKMTRGQSAS